MIIVYVTFSSLYEAQDLSTKLLDEKIIACFNTFPIQGAYLWMGEIKNSNEIVSLLKTRKDNWQKLKNRVCELHTYDTPCILKIDVESTEEYEKWIEKETNI